MNTSPNRSSNAADAAAVAAAVPTEQQVRARAALLFRDAVAAGQLHPLMPLFIRYRLQQAQP